MATTPTPILLDTDSELARAISAAADADRDVIVELDGVHYRLDRIDDETDPDDEWRRPEGFDPKRVLNIIGLGGSGGSDIARHKDEYIADAVDHRE